MNICRGSLSPTPIVANVSSYEKVDAASTDIQALPGRQQIGSSYSYGVFDSRNNFDPSLSAFDFSSASVSSSAQQQQQQQQQKRQWPHLVKPSPVPAIASAVLRQLNCSALNPLGNSDATSSPTFSFDASVSKEVVGDCKHLHIYFR